MRGPCIKSRQTPATALDMKQSSGVAQNLQLLPDFIPHLPASPVLLFTGLSLTERPAPMLFIGGKGVGGGRSGVSAERRKLIQKLRDGGFLPRAATVKPRWATEISFNGLTRRKWTRSCPLARPSRAFAFSQIPFAVSQTAQVSRTSAAGAPVHRSPAMRDEGGIWLSVMTATRF